jgi:hypothetical protein
MLKSYKILKEIQDHSQFVRPGHFVLNIEPWNTGFPEFLDELGARLLILTRGNPTIKNREWEVKEYDLKTISPYKITLEKVNCIVNELRLDIISSFQILGRFIGLLKDDGKVLSYLSTKNRTPEEAKELAEGLFKSLGLKVKEYYSTDEGLYVLARRPI